MEAAVPTPLLAAGRSFAVPGPHSLFWPLCTLGLMVVLHLDIALHRAVNWDEFYHYSQIEAFRSGARLDPLQTLHARIFAWAADLPGNAVDHLRVIRPIILCFLLGAAGAIYALAERFASRPVALSCALLYLSAGFVMQHGASLRADAMTAALLMTALAIAARCRLTPWAIVAVALLCALATLETIKTVLYAPAFLGIAWLRWSEARFSKEALLRLAAIPFVAAVLFAVLYLAQNHTLGPAANDAAVGVIERSQHKMFALGGLPYYVFILKAALMALIFAACVILAPVLIARRRELPAHRIALGGLWLPITVLGFYHNTAPYFYVFILPPVAAACAPAIAWFVKRYSLRALASLLAVNALVVWTVEDRDVLAKQHRLLDAADEIVGQPVAYFDSFALLGTYPKANHFMTPWGQEGYLAGHGKSFRQIMQERTVPLTIEIETIFERLFESHAPTPDFLPADAAALRENYVRFWGPYRLAGRDLPARAAARRSEFLVPGPYTAVGGAVRFDGRTFGPGQVFKVTRGWHTIGAAGPGDARMIWGEHLAAPAAPPPTPPFWALF